MKLRNLFVAFAALLLLGACARGGEGEKPKLAVSVEPQKELLQAIVGDDYDIVTILPPAGDVETFEPSVATLTDLQKAQAYFRIGNVGFEEALLPKLKENFPNLNIVETAKGIETVEDTHGHDADPHLWSSVENVRIIAFNLLTEVKKLNPEKSDAYTANYNQLDSTLTALDSQIRKLVAAAPTKSFAIWHPSLSYFARDYDLHQIAFETDGKETTPRELQQRIDLMKDSGVTVLFYERAHGASQAENLARQHGIKAVPISLNDAKWRESLLNVANALNGK